MRARVCLAVLILAGVVGFSGSATPRAVARVDPGPGNLHARRSGRAGRHGLQLRHRARARRARTLQLPRGSFDLHFMDIAATVNPATVHFRSLTEPSRVERARAELRVRPARARQAAAQVRRPRRHAGAARAPRTARRREEEVKARLLSYNNAPVWQIGNEIVTGLQRRSHPVSRAARQSLHAADADLDARQRRRRRGIASRRRISPASCRGTPTTC